MEAKTQTTRSAMAGAGFGGALATLAVIFMPDIWPAAGARLSDPTTASVVTLAMATVFTKVASWVKPKES